MTFSEWLAKQVDRRGGYDRIGDLARLAVYDDDQWFEGLESFNDCQRVLDERGFTNWDAHSALADAWHEFEKGRRA